MKNFYDTWSEDEVSNYLGQNPVLVLFKLDYISREAEIIIHANLNEKQKSLLRSCIVGEFGGKRMSEDMCIKINEYAERWYEDYIKSPKIRVINFGGKK